MKITKLGHSCVLVETEDRIGIFDPGVWSDKQLIDAVRHVDRIIYTHEHSDHFDVEILKNLVKKFPNVHVVCNQEINKKIISAGIDVVVREETNCAKKFVSPHESLPIPNAVAPAENGYHFQELFTHPGDSQHFFETKKVLSMPFIGPWGKTGDSITKVIELKPEYVLPIHDWHYTDDAKEWLQELLTSVFSEHGITLLPNKNGEVIEVL